MSLAKSLVVLDFETSGGSPKLGERAIEIGAVRIQDGIIVDQFTALMNPGFRVSSFIEQYTGISNAMLEQAESCAVVMNRFADFIADSNMIAHNASFDKAFLDSEFAFIGRKYTGVFSCSLLLARRVLQSAPNHKLASLIEYQNLHEAGQYHRALYDAKMAAKLWVSMIEELEQRCGLSQLSFDTILRLNKTAKKDIDHFLSRLSSTEAF